MKKGRKLARGKYKKDGNEGEILGEEKTIINIVPRVKKKKGDDGTPERGSGRDRGVWQGIGVGCQVSS